ncbi:MAG: TetR/AcrR family transcriptional regulator [Pirellulales bacterium]|nr:TetR/AcrR family transcriptional regulator [Pirellulales bacterium]
MAFNCTHKPVVELFGVPPAPRTGRTRLIYAAIELVYSYGFQAIGVDQIVAAAGVTKTTFYKHFDGKDDLLAAAIQQRDEWEMQAWTAAVERIAADDPKAQLLAMFDVLDVWFNAPEFRGCQFINAAAEFPDPRDPVHQIAARHKRKTRDYFRDLAAKAGAEEPEAFADHYTALVEGTLVLRQVHGRDDAAQAIKPAIERLVAESLP